MNPCVSSGSSFGDDFWDCSNLVFVDSFRVNRGGVHWRVHASALNTVSVMNSESEMTWFSLTISNSIGAVCAGESMCHLWKQFRWQFMSRKRLTFSWLFLSQQGCERWQIHASALEPVSGMIYESAVTQFSLTISKLTGSVCAGESIRHLWKQFGWLFLRRQQLSLHWLFLSQQGLCALMNKCVTYGSSFINHFLVGNDSVFLDCFWVNRGCGRCRIHASALQAVSVMISKSAATQLSLTISECTGVCALTSPCVSSWSSFGDDF
jgi:hypothetical protein